MPVDPNHRTLKRRASELRQAAAACADADTSALLTFYAAECILKAYYMSRFSLRTTDAENAMAKSARSYGHRLDDILIQLRVRSADCPTRPSAIRLKTGAVLSVSELHEAWRYGEKVDNQSEVMLWLNAVVSYAEARV